MRRRRLRGNGEYNSRQSNTNDKNLRSSGKYHKPSPLHLGKLRRMLTADPTDAVLDLLKHEDQLQNILENEHIKDDFIELLLEILAKVNTAKTPCLLLLLLSLKGRARDRPWININCPGRQITLKIVQSSSFHIL